MFAHDPKFKNSNGRLQITFTYQGNRNYLSLGVPDSNRNREDFKVTIDLIKQDIRNGTFDLTLNKYRPERTLRKKSEPKIEELTLDRLWEKYTEFKRPQLSPSTIAKDFDRVTRHIAKFPSVKPIDAIAIRDYLVDRCTIATAKKVLTQTSACLDWAVKSRLAANNPFKGMAADLKSPKGTEESDIDPFLQPEYQAIIDYFWEFDCHYAPLVEFLFRTGCRPSEAVALTWSQIRSECKTISFDRAVVEGESGLVLKDRLKTQPRRDFPCNQKLTDFLQSLVTDSPSPDDLVFPSPQRFNSTKS